MRPALDRIARAAQCSPDELVLLLEPVEDQGLITMAGNAIAFTHPLLSSGVYTNATNAQRRAVHRRLAEVVDSPELRARHLALASAGADPETLAALDAAVAVAAAQGAPATAAELLELAIARGGDTPLRRILCATHHFTAGDAESAQKLLAGVVDELPPGPVRATALLMLGGISVYTDGFTAAAGWLRQGIETTTDPAMLAQLHMMLSFTQMNLGAFADAERALDVAAARAEDLGSDAVRSQVLSLQTMLGCLRGDGICPDRRRRALELEDRELLAPVIFRATANEMQLRFWEGDLTGGLELYEQLWRSAAGRGAESELLFLAVQGTLGSSWKGDLARATAIARDATERADQLGGDNSELIAAVARAGPAALTGRIDHVRQACTEATEIAVRRGADRIQYAAASSLGLLEVSLGRYPEAVDALSGTIVNFRREPWMTEIHSAVFVSEAVEALVALDRLDVAESLITAMETGGARLGRPWTIAEGARGRAMLLVARGASDGAETAVRRALAEHDHLEVAFTRARSAGCPPDRVVPSAGLYFHLMMQLPGHSKVKK